MNSQYAITSEQALGQFGNAYSSNVALWHFISFHWMKSCGKTIQMNHLWKIFWRVTIFLFKYFTTQNLHLEFLLLRTSVHGVQTV